MKKAERKGMEREWKSSFKRVNKSFVSHYQVVQYELGVITFPHFNDTVTLAPVVVVVPPAAIAACHHKWRIPFQFDRHIGHEGSASFCWLFRVRFRAVLIHF